MGSALLPVRGIGVCQQPHRWGKGLSPGPQHRLFRAALLAVFSCQKRKQPQDHSGPATVQHRYFGADADLPDFHFPVGEFLPAGWFCDWGTADHVLRAHGVQSSLGRAPVFVGGTFDAYASKTPPLSKVITK